MIARRRFGMFLAIAGLLTLAASGYFWRGDAARRAEIGTEKAALEDSAKRIHDQIVQTSLKLRGFQASLPEIPDTVRRYGGKKIMEVSEVYRKTIHKLEVKERDVSLEIKALDRETVRERAAARARAVPAAIVGILATVIGVILMAIPERRVGA